MVRRYVWGCASWVGWAVWARWLPFCVYVIRVGVPVPFVVVAIGGGEGDIEVASVSHVCWCRKVFGEDITGVGIGSYSPNL